MKRSSSQKGFTLLEVMIAMFIFVIMISASIIALMNVFKSYNKAKEVQGHLDNAQYSMNLMMKSLRTSSLISASSDDGIVIFDYSKDECIQYKFDGGEKSLLMRFVASDYESCKDEGFGGVDFNFMTTGDVTGKFWATESNDTQVGSITVLMRIDEGERTEVNIQSSVSLRDYKVSEIELGI